MTPLKNTLCLAQASSRKCPQKGGCEDLHSITLNRECEERLKSLLQEVLSTTTRIRDNRLINFILDSQAESVDCSSQSSQPLDLIVSPSFGPEKSSLKPCFSFQLNREIKQACCGTVCPLMGHGMAVNDNMNCTDEDQDDSGFGSGPRPSCSMVRVPEDTDLQVLERNVLELSASGCYYGPLDSASARKLLKRSEMGTFLVRDSSDPNYLYSLTVKTERGATSVRILYAKGLFQFDSDEKLRHRLPQFGSIMSLIDFHTMLSRDGKNQKWRWEEYSGKKIMKVVLYQPRKCTVSSLQHLSRVKINQCLENVHLPELSVDRLPMLPIKLKDYLKEYPYRV